MLSWIKNGLQSGLTAYITHSDCMLHNVGDMHPECPQRLVAIRDQLMASQIFDSLHEVEAPEVTDEQLARVHTPRYLEYLEMSQPLTGTFRVDPDTALMPNTLKAARRAAGGVVKAVDMCAKVKHPMHSVPFAHRGIMPNRQRRWGFATSITSRSAFVMP